MAHHAPFKSLSPLSWEPDIAPLLEHDDSSSSSSPTLSALLKTTFADAALLIDSIPSPFSPSSPSARTTKTRARAHTESAVGSARGKELAKYRGSKDVEGEETVTKLQAEWKEVVSPSVTKGNVNGIAVYKLGSKDGKGAWFARRSVHYASTSQNGGREFDKWVAALRSEMKVTLKRVEETPGMEPGTGNIRGIGAERRVDGKVCDDGTVDLYHVSARFPGPASARDFVTLMMMPPEERGKIKSRPPRQFMIVSRPCEHPDCPPRSSFVRGTYESVELIREVPVDKPLRRVRSSVDLTAGDTWKEGKNDDGEDTESEGDVRALPSGIRRSHAVEDTEMAIEWLMITRSNPGGSVPRFMIEKGTPGGIIADADKFLAWLSSLTLDDLAESPCESEDGSSKEKLSVEQTSGQEQDGPAEPTPIPDGKVVDNHDEPQVSKAASLSGDVDGISDTSSEDSFASATEGGDWRPDDEACDISLSSNDNDVRLSIKNKNQAGNHRILSAPNSGSAPSLVPSSTSINTTASSTSSSPSETAAATSAVAARLSRAQARHDKEINKLRERMLKEQAKLEKRAEARKQKQKQTKKNDQGNSSSTESVSTPTPEATAASAEDSKTERDLARIRDKYGQAVARQEEKFRQEAARLILPLAAAANTTRTNKKENSQHGNQQQATPTPATDLEVAATTAADVSAAAALVVAAAERERDQARAERDAVRRELDMLRERVGELQAQNTMLVAKLGTMMGLPLDAKGLVVEEERKK